MSVVQTIVASEVPIVNKVVNFNAANSEFELDTLAFTAIDSGIYKVTAYVSWSVANPTAGDFSGFSINLNQTTLENFFTYSIQDASGTQYYQVEKYITVDKENNGIRFCNVVSNSLGINAGVPNPIITLFDLSKPILIELRLNKTLTSGNYTASLFGFFLEKISQ